MGKRKSKNQRDSGTPISSKARDPPPPKKLPSLRGTHVLPLHAAGAFTKAPSPRSLPRPPTRWTSSSTGTDVPGVHVRHASPPIALQNSDMVVKQLQGNLLYTLIAPEYPQLAGKITGMLLELSAQEVADILGDSAARRRLIDEALEVLREAGDPRVDHTKATSPEKGPTGLTIDIDATAALERSFECTSSMRISPRVSSNPFSSGNILRLQG
mmetsp:Transcript_16811/g.35462  ORF Transcript_16811/g.35462 Transcript_16811/m.35462 type:complete len:213 (+) Transcript_16811:149-787(+)